MMLLNIGVMYVNRISLENYDSELLIEFTSDLNNAKRFDLKDTYIISIIENVLNTKVTVVYETTEKEPTE